MIRLWRKLLILILALAMCIPSTYALFKDEYWKEGVKVLEDKENKTCITHNNLKYPQLIFWKLYYNFQKEEENFSIENAENFVQASKLILRLCTLITDNSEYIPETRRSQYCNYKNKCILKDCYYKALVLNKNLSQTLCNKQDLMKIYKDYRSLLFTLNCLNFSSKKHEFLRRNLIKVIEDACNKVECHPQLCVPLSPVSNLSHSSVTA